MCWGWGFGESGDTETQRKRCPLLSPYADMLACDTCGCAALMHAGRGNLRMIQLTKNGKADKWKEGELWCWEDVAFTIPGASLDLQALFCEISFPHCLQELGYDFLLLASSGILFQQRMQVLAALLGFTTRPNPWCGAGKEPEKTGRWCLSRQ